MEISEISNNGVLQISACSIHFSSKEFTCYEILGIWNKFLESKHIQLPKGIFVWNQFKTERQCLCENLSTEIPKTLQKMFPNQKLLSWNILESSTKQIMFDVMSGLTGLKCCFFIGNIEASENLKLEYNQAKKNNLLIIKIF